MFATCLSRTSRYSYIACDLLCVPRLHLRDGLVNSRIHGGIHLSLRPDASHRGPGSQPPPRTRGERGTANTRCHQRGSKTLSETKAMRRGISSSRSVESVSSVRRSVASSSWHSEQVGGMRFGLPTRVLIEFAQRVGFPVRFRFSGNTTHDSPRTLCLRKAGFRIGARITFSRSSAVYSRDFTVDTGHSRISAISSNLNP